jgi:minor extracellular protease Epr
MNNLVLLRSALLLFCLAVAANQAGFDPVGPAMAQSDDDDDDDDDDDGGGDDGGGDDGGGDDGGGDDGAGDDGGGDDGAGDDGGGSGGSGGGGAATGDDDGKPGRRETRVKTPGNSASVAGPSELPLAVPGELVTLALTDADVAVLEVRGYRVLEERAVSELGAISRRLSVPAGTTLDAARDEIRALSPGADADLNHYYRSEESISPAVCNGPHCASFDLVGWNVVATVPCVADIPVGVIDTGINPDHPAFATSRLEVHRLTPGELEPSRASHGTAVASLLIGDPSSRSPGLIPGSRVVAVDAFHFVGGDERADVYTLVAAMDFLATQDVRIINMSLAGPSNTVLEETVAKLVAQDILLVAAAGNVGPEADPAYPAAYPGVVAVTAIDKSGTVYRRAGQGEHVDLAAPGVDIWTAASIKGARPKTGTSFAAPFVSAAAAAYLSAEPALTTDALILRLTTTAKDLGAPGQDTVYGHGLVQAGPACLKGNPADTP